MGYFTSLFVAYSEAGVFDGHEERRVVKKIVDDFGLDKTDHKSRSFVCDTCGETKFASEFDKTYNRGCYATTCKQCKSDK